jgi:hypothetical protein
MYFQFAKIHPYLKGFRQKMNLAEWMQSLEKVATCSPRARKRLADMRQFGSDDSTKTRIRRSKIAMGGRLSNIDTAFTDLQ